ncbi:cellulose binding domain-containing protein [Streptosporangium sp. NPDC048865]|uniref:cellulose binding domain-containing protein n=1 Tax=Streptosporangium sp. NPDC048865 TaxID=3155766 RepID=UPI0034398585
MTDRRVPPRRRLTAWLVAVLLGTVGALTVVTPARAADTCTFTFRANAWPTIDGQVRWQVDATLVNVSAKPSTDWVTTIRFPVDAVIPQYWNVTRVTASRWIPASWNKVIPPGQSAYFGFEVRTPTWDVSPLPTTKGCRLIF